MTQDDIELLMKDLCARLFYGVICTDSRHGDSKITEIDVISKTVYCDDFDEYAKIENIKPYLRSMSSMTEEEKKEYHKTFRAEAYGNGYVYVESVHSFDWLNKHNFDYRGLIEKGLALEAPKGMYNLKEK